MGRSRKPTPRYLKHKQSGRARAVWTDASGQWHEQVLPGAYGSEESRTAFGRLLLETEVQPRGANVKSRDGLSLNKVLDAYRCFAEGYYRHTDGTLTSTIHEVKIVLRALRVTYGDTPAAEFSPSS